MNCKHIEELLPAYLEADLRDDEMSTVRSHVASCDGCKSALLAFESIEEALVMRRDAVPALDGLLPQIEPVLEEANARLRRFFDMLYSLPGLVTTTLLSIGIVMFFYRDLVGTYLTAKMAQPLTWNSVAAGVNSQLVAKAGAEAWMVGTVYGVVSVMIVASMGYMTMRFLRD
jgi:anti-sigma factor RsiW